MKKKHKSEVTEAVDRALAALNAYVKDPNNKAPRAPYRDPFPKKRNRRQSAQDFLAIELQERGLAKRYRIAGRPDLAEKHEELADKARATADQRAKEEQARQPHI